MNIFVTTLVSIAVTLVSVFGAYNYLPVVEPINLIHEDGLLGTSVTTINASDTLKNSRTVINDNFTALNNGKIEVSTTSLPLVTTLSGLTTAGSLATIGTVTSGTWNGAVIGVPYGGTGRSSFTANAVLLGNGTSGIATTSAGSEGEVLKMVSGVPDWDSVSVNQSSNYTWTGQHTFQGDVVIQDDVINGNIVVQRIASTTISAYQMVSISTSTGKVILCDANDPATDYKFFGQAITGGTDGQNINILVAGEMTNITATAGLEYFCSDTAGAVSSTQGTYPIRIGVSASANTIMVDKKTITGTPISISSGTSYYAVTDGTATGYGTAGSTGGNVAATNGVFTLKDFYTSGSAITEGSVTLPVKKGQTYSVTCTAGSGGTCEQYFTPIN